MPEIKFMLNEAAISIDDILVIPDLHIGYEYELWKKGINIPSQTEKILKRIINLIKENSINHLIILGDVKHEIYRASYQEEREIPEFFNELLKYSKVSLVKGNHDGGIETLLPKEVEIYPSQGFRIKNVAFAHGNAWISKDSLQAKTLITGHLHPSVEFKDHFGKRLSEYCWIKAKIKPEEIKKKYKTDSFNLEEMIVMPTFNRLTGGTPVNSKEANREMGPFMKNVIDKKTVEVFLLDGTSLGNV